MGHRGEGTVRRQRGIVDAESPRQLDLEMLDGTEIGFP